MGRRVEILRALVREELMRQRSSRASLSEMIRFAHRYAHMHPFEREQLQELADTDARISIDEIYEDIDMVIAELRDEEDLDDDDEDLREIPPSI